MRNSIIAFTSSLGLAVVIASSPAQSRTWYVNISGTGDAPTIAAAIDSAVYGDSVLVGPGTYEVEDGMTIGAGVVVISEFGPTQTKVFGIIGSGALLPPGIFSLLSNSELHGFWIDNSSVANVWTGEYCQITHNIIGGGGGTHHIDIQDPTAVILNNLFLPGGQGIGVTLGGGAFFAYNIVYCEIDCRSSPPTAICNDLVGPDTPCLQLIQQWFPGQNFSADPEFCGVEGSDDYYLQVDSPCAPGNTPLGGDCGLIGPLPVGCGPVSTEVKSWGAVKSLYRE